MIHSIEYKKVNEIFGGLLAQQVLVLFVQVRILVVQRRKALKEISFGAFSFFVDAKSLLKSLERSHTEQQHDDFYSLVAKAEEDALKKYLSIRM